MTTKHDGQKMQIMIAQHDPSLSIPITQFAQNFERIWATVD